MKKIVVKIGTGVITDKQGKLDEPVIQELVKQISAFLKDEKRIVLVSSGAIGAGMGLLGITKRPDNLAELQSIASVGQTHLMDVYNSNFSKEGYLTGQILLTQSDFDNRARYLNIKYTINALLENGIVPIVNENDTISTEEIKCGDNDRLSSLVADLIEADSLIILSDVDGLFDKDGSIIKELEAVSEEVFSLVKKEKSTLGTGGMTTKIKAAEFCITSGIDCYIAGGRTKDVLKNIVEEKGNYTYFKASSKKVTARKRWIGFGSTIKGEVTVDEGGCEAILKKNKSLLSVGVIAAKGDFAAGDIVGVFDKQKKEIGRGITNYSSAELNKIKGVKTKDIESILGYKDHDEVIHRDNMVIL